VCQRGWDMGQLLSGQAVFEGPEDIATVFNAAARAQQTIVTLERPQGTFSQNLWSLLARIDGATGPVVEGIVAADYVAYVRTWMQLANQARSRAENGDSAKAENGETSAAQSQQTQQQNLPRQAVPPEQLSIRSARTIFDLRLEGDVSIGGTPQPTRITLSIRPAAGRDAHPYLIHQLLVQDGFKPLYRLRPAGAAMAK
jgi:hypothetical protein